jgi:phosphoribosyl 1,2-cyclic phosphodiesterase
VTHEHADHLKGLDVLARHLEVPVYATEGTLGEFLHIRRQSAKSVETRRCRYGERITLDGFTIEPFATSHDAREPCGFTIEEGGLRMGCCTDTGVITNVMREVLKRCNSLILESNHSTEMLAHGPYPEVLKRRIRSRVGHLSNEAARHFLHELSGDLQTVILAHLSEANNTPEKALASGREGLGLYYNDVPLHVASMITHPACWEQWIEL